MYLGRMTDDDYEVIGIMVKMFCIIGVILYCINFIGTEIHTTSHASGSIYYKEHLKTHWFTKCDSRTCKRWREERAKRN